MMPFEKMHGLGNDFVVLDTRNGQAAPGPEAVRAIADRHRGVGFDQMLILEPPRAGGDVYLRILNPDASEAEACGNGTRCVASLILTETGTQSCVIETLAGQLQARQVGEEIEVDMGAIALGWRDVPLAHEIETAAFPVAGFEALGPAAAAALGNPHVTFFVPDVAAIDLDDLGPKLEHHSLFPRRANITFAQIIAADHIKARVWERAAGATLACGSAACATAVNAARRGLGARTTRVDLPGGTLTLRWADDGHVWMRGPTAKSFTGVFDPALWGAG